MVLWQRLSVTGNAIGTSGAPSVTRIIWTPSLHTPALNQQSLPCKLLQNTFVEGMPVGVPKLALKQFNLRFVPLAHALRWMAKPTLAIRME